MASQLTDKVAIVTGGNRGIGKAIAIRFAQEGADLVVAARNADLCELTAAEIRAFGRRAESVPTDVANEADVAALFDRTMNAFGRVDILVNNAGIGAGGPVADMSTEDFDRVIATNLRGTFLCSRAAFRVMMKLGGGRIINVSSLLGVDAWAGTGAYSASKWGILGLARAISDEGRAHGIKVTTLCPGGVASSMVDDPEALRSTDMISPYDIAAAALYAATLGQNVILHEIVIERTGAD